MTHFDKLMHRYDQIYEDCFKRAKEQFEESFEIFVQKIEKANGGIIQLSAGLSIISEDESSSTNVESIKENVKPKKNQQKDCEPVEHITKEKEVEQPVQDSIERDESNERRQSNKRSLEDMQEAEDVANPKADKRPKRAVSTMALVSISKQINQNLHQKLRRPDAEENTAKHKSGATKKPDSGIVEDMEFANVKVKLEKLSTASCTANGVIPTEIVVKQEKISLMPPPAVPTKSSRRGTAATEDESAEVRKSTRTKRKKNLPDYEVELPASSSARSTRASTRASTRTKNDSVESVEMPPPAELPKKRGRKPKEVPKESQGAEKSEDMTSETSVVVKKEPRPKRTRKAAKKDRSQNEESVPQDKDMQAKEAEIEPKNSEAISDVPPVQHSVSSPVIPTQPAKKRKSKEKIEDVTDCTSQTSLKNVQSQESKTPSEPVTAEIVSPIMVAKPLKKLKRTYAEEDVATVTSEAAVSKPASRRNTPEKVEDMDALEKTLILDNAACTPKLKEQSQPPPSKPLLNETIVINKATSFCTPNHIQSSTMNGDMTNDDSVMTADESEVQNTPQNDQQITPANKTYLKETSSAVKEKVKQFEDLASGRVTRTKTRALAKQLGQEEQIPTKQVLGAATLAKLQDYTSNFMSKPNHASQSAIKPCSNLITTIKSFLPSSTSKLPPVNHNTTAIVKNMEKEDAIKKKEALLEAKREEQKRRREQKMAAAAAAREAAAREREKQLALAAKERLEKVAHQDQTRLEKQREAERKKQLQERKAIEMEERRKAEEAARLARLEEEQRKAEAARKKLIEAERIKREAANQVKEMQAVTQQYLAKEKEKLMMKKRLEADLMHVSMTEPGTPAKKMAPVHMADGFQYLQSDSEDDQPAPRRIPPSWSQKSERMPALMAQALVAMRLIDKLFSVQKHSPDLTELFPKIDHRKLKRTSSACWTTPPRLPPNMRDC